MFLRSTMWNFLEPRRSVQLKTELFLQLVETSPPLVARRWKRWERCLETKWNSRARWVDERTERCSETWRNLEQKELKERPCGADYCFHLVAEWEESVASQLSRRAFDLFSNGAGTQGFWPLALQDWIACQLHAVSISHCGKSLSAKRGCAPAWPESVFFNPTFRAKLWNQMFTEIANCKKMLICLAFILLFSWQAELTNFHQLPSLKEAWLRGGGWGQPEMISFCTSALKLLVKNKNALTEVPLRPSSLSA